MVKSKKLRVESKRNNTPRGNVESTIKILGITSTTTPLDPNLSALR